MLRNTCPADPTVLLAPVPPRASVTTPLGVAVTVQVLPRVQVWPLTVVAALDAAFVSAYVLVAFCVAILESELAASVPSVSRKLWSSIVPGVVAI